VETVEEVNIEPKQRIWSVFMTRNPEDRVEWNRGASQRELRLMQSLVRVHAEEELLI